MQRVLAPVSPVVEMSRKRPRADELRCSIAVSEDRVVARLRIVSSARLCGAVPRLAAASAQLHRGLRRLIVSAAARRDALGSARGYFALSNYSIPISPFFEVGEIRLLIPPGHSSGHTL